MNRNFIVIALLILSVSTFAFADPSDQVITLKDGSQIKGVLSGIDNGIYTIKTPIIGDVHVASSDVASITNGNVQVPAPAASAANPFQNASSIPNMDDQIAASQKQLMSNPQNMAILTQMAQDPEIAQALSDPALVQAVSSHDYAAVQNNPKVQELMSNPKMKALLDELKQQNQPTQ